MGPREMTEQPAPVVFVAGVSRGIGAATAQVLLARDCRVIGASRSRPDFTHPRFQWIQADSNDDAAVGAAFATVERVYGRLDGLINSAGQYYAGALEEHTMEQVQAQFDAYFFSVVRTIRAALPLLRAVVEVAEASLADAYTASGSKQRLIGQFCYAANGWSHERRVITRLEYGAQGTNPRFVVTHLQGDPEALYEGLYCQRGEAENRIKEAQLDLFGTRASCSRFVANPLRLLLAALAYTLMQRLRALALQDTELQRASAATLRVRLLKIGAAILRNTRRVRVMLASHHPLRELFAMAAARLAALSP